MTPEGKPEWAQMSAKADRLMRESHRLDEIAERRRCPKTESNGHRCTRDKGHEPADAHRIDPKDMP